ncbi:innexin inx3-like [Bacillus rossius redtenbacheri]|uniref:innexin inx3-like n=1 Tax=Bacillus rossius redtenbacheri TaxID=93214 RepID=UPI002FDE1DBD
MLALVTGLRGRVKARGPGHVAVGPLASPLHHAATAVLLLACCLLVCVRQYFGQPVHCLLDVMGDDSAVNEHVLNTYCFVAATYTVLPEEGGRGLGQPHAGVGPDWWRGKQLPRRRHAYYQWVPLALFLQFLSFRAPHLAWERWEGGLVRASLGGLAGARPLLLGAQERHQLLRRLAGYFEARRGSHRYWAAGYLACDLLQLLNVAANLLLTDVLLGGTFAGYGLQVVKFLQLHPEDGRYDAIDAVFPKVTKCTFYKYGPSGSLQNLDALCVMALNVVNEKIYTALWFWLLPLAAVSAAALLWRLVVAGALVRGRTGWAARLTAPGLPAWAARRLDLGDWLYLHLLLRNMDPALRPEFQEQLAAARADGEAGPVIADC